MMYLAVGLAAGMCCSALLLLFAALAVAARGAADELLDLPEFDGEFLGG